MAKSAKPKGYTAEDGLKLLDYLGITAVTEEEKRLFREHWSEFYEARDKDAVMATWTLYAEFLPYTLRKDERGAFALATLRDSDFGERLEKTELDKELKKGIPLETILKRESHKFYHPVKVVINLEPKISS